MSQHERHEACVYIGPAALCPKPEEGKPYVLITGDQEEWVKPLIEERLGGRKESANFVIQQNTIGKPGTTKTWHCFNHPSLNGVNDEETIRWCNPAWDIDYLGCKEIENKKLQDILTESKLIDQTFHLVIAQGDPHLTLKRSTKLLKNCLSVDLSLHPWTAWRRSIDKHPRQQGFQSGEPGT